MVLAHIPLFLLFLGVEFFPIIIWVGVVENIPLLFLDANNISWFEIGEFGIKNYAWRGLIITLTCKYFVFLLLILLFDICFKKWKFS